MHAIILGKDLEYFHLEAREKGQLILRDGTRYTFEVIDMPYWTCEAPDRNSNVVQVERLAYGAGKWMLGSESFFESLDKIQRAAWNKLDEARSVHQLPRISWRDFQAAVSESSELCFLQQTRQEAEIVRQINSEFFGPNYARRWGLAQVLREQQNKTLQSEVCAAAWFEGNGTPLLLRDFSEINATAKKQSSELQEDKPAPSVINETVLQHVQQLIMDALDTELKAQPTHYEVFIRYCRDKMQLAKMQRKFPWKYRTLKSRKAALERFLQTKFRLTLAAFFVDRRIFTAAERQLKERAKRISRRSLGECDSDRDDE